MTRNKLLLLSALAIYLAGYPVARSMHLVVHAAGFYGNPDGTLVVAEHRMRAGDVGFPMLHPGAALTVMCANLLYFPVMPLEVAFWSIVEPTGSPYPYSLVPLDEPAAEAP